MTCFLGAASGRRCGVKPHWRLQKCVVKLKKKIKLKLLTAILAIIALLSFAQPPEEETITIATFNIQDFGKAKMAKPEVVSQLVEIVRQYDVVAIQEISDKDQTVMPLFLQEINNLGEPLYQYTIGPRVGTSSKEQYAYLYREEINLTNNFTFNYEFERDPYLACFIKESFGFCLATIHTPPDSAPKEVAMLYLVAEQLNMLDEDYLILGDFNADCSYMNEAQVSILLTDHVWIVPSSADTTVSQTDCAYDRIVASPSIHSRFRDWGIYQIESRTVSDHHPVWASFST